MKRKLNMENTFVLRRKSDGWFVADGAKHTSDPVYAIKLNKSELTEWLATWGSGYEAISTNVAKEVVE